MRILLAIGSNRTRNELTPVLEAKGHQMVTSASRGEDLLLSIEEAAPIHAALLSQAALGGEWLKLLRQLRQRDPGLRTVVLLRPGAEQHWRHAMMAGAFEALTGSVPGNGVLDAVCHALAATGVHPPAQPAAHRDGRPAPGRAEARMAAARIVDRRHAP
jgi:DNA-binding NarL/FixJ family response regulator